jgi:hypothetical protein
MATSLMCGRCGFTQELPDALPDLSGNVIAPAQWLAAASASGFDQVVCHHCLTAAEEADPSVPRIDIDG